MINSWVCKVHLNQYILHVTLCVEIFGVSLVKKGKFVLADITSHDHEHSQ